MFLCVKINYTQRVKNNMFEYAEVGKKIIP
jgi:hypothetical protein